MGETTVRWLLALLVIAFVGLGITYALVMPCFEQPDEWSHLSVVRYFATHKAMPPRVIPSRRATTGSDMAWYLEYHDPPLYYAPPLYYSLAGLLVSWADMGDMPYLMVPSPSWELGWVPEPDGTSRNKNLYAHRAEEAPVQSGTVQAMYLLRMLSLGLGAVTVLSAYALSRLVWPGQRTQALGAAAFVALNPKFISVSAGVTNDSLLNALSGLALVWALRCMCEAAAWSRWAVLGGLVGLGALTKQSGLLLLPWGLLAVVLQRGSVFPLRRKVLIDGGAYLAAALGVGGWWYVRNAALYADPLGLEPHLAIQDPLAQFGLAEFLKIARGYWAAFGWAPILVEPWMYAAAGLVVLIGLVGMVVALCPGSCLWFAPPVTGRGLALLALAFGLNVVTLVRWAIQLSAPIGRLLFPTLPAVGVLIAWGLSQWGRWAALRWGLGVVVVLAFLLAAVVPWRYLRPAYASPRLPDGMPGTAQPVGLTFRGGVRLAGYEPVKGDLEPGEELPLTLFWHVSAPANQRYRVWVQLGPRDPTTRVAEDGFWLGGTLYPSDLWRAGDTVRQVFHLAIPDWTSAPGLYWVRIGLEDDAEARVPLANHDSDMVVLGPWRMRAISTPRPPACATRYRLGETIRLLGYDLEQGWETETESVELALYWQAEQTPEVDYIVYVHLLDGEGELVGQHDACPRDGAYPTSWWLPDQVVVDRHAIALDKSGVGPMRITVGMYDRATLTRLPAYDDMGGRLPDDTIPLVEGVPGGGDAQCTSD